MERPTEVKLDRQKVQDFARRLFGHYTSGILTLLVHIGHQTGLFDATAKGPGTSQEIAARAGLDERYVREWLAAMATGEYVARLSSPFIHLTSTFAKYYKGLRRRLR